MLNEEDMELCTRFRDRKRSYFFDSFFIAALGSGTEIDFTRVQR